ncbi:hypothetical protein BGZ94_009894 [Podila epigama]|nr:hypothetical protein BGZ94_009894 [Podila epigama]
MVAMARSASTLLLLVALLCSAVVQATTVYVRYYDYSNTIGGVTRERHRVQVQIEGYHGELSGSITFGRSKYCSKDGVFCAEALGADCNYNHRFKFYYANRSTEVDFREKPSCDFWPKDPQCKTCNKGELSFRKKNFAFNI